MVLIFIKNYKFIVAKRRQATLLFYTDLNSGISVLLSTKLCSTSCTIYIYIVFLDETTIFVFKQKHKIEGGPLKEMALFTRSRLSVQPLTKGQLLHILTLMSCKNEMNFIILFKSGGLKKL